jgi:molybdenum cofactor cytidylyltransferase
MSSVASSQTKRVAALVLAAGASRRLGSPKQMAMLGGETLLERSVRVAREAGLQPVIVVVGAEWEFVLARSSLRDAVTVVNEDWAEGMASSIRLGVKTLKLIAAQAEGVLLMTCDQPAVTAEYLQLLAASADMKASRYAGRKGIPAYFPAAYFDRLTELHGDSGARKLLVNAQYLEFAGGELDVDTAEDLERVRELFGVPGGM